MPDKKTSYFYLTWTEGVKRRSSDFEVWSKIYVHVAIQAQEWVSLNNKDSVEGEEAALQMNKKCGTEF